MATPESKFSPEFLESQEFFRDFSKEIFAFLKNIKLTGENKTSADFFPKIAAEPKAAAIFETVKYAWSKIHNKEIAAILEQYITDKSRTDIQSLFLNPKYSE